MKIKVFLFLYITGILIACDNTQVTSGSTTPESITEPTNQVVLMSDVKWSPLNPARGDQSPQAATLWGDRNKAVTTGFLVKFLEGFSSPPHIHNVTYRGVVISGLIHNDDPDAEEMWMPAGSFWTQPAGEAHITAAKGSENIAFIEIGEGPYLVRSPEEAFDNGERPVNVDQSNIVWVDASNITWVNLPDISASANELEVAFLWGSPQDGQLSGTLIKLAAGFIGKIRSQGSNFHAVVIQGQPQYQVPGETDGKTLAPGSYFSSKGASVHQVSSEEEKESILYIRTDDQFDILAVEPEK